MTRDEIFGLINSERNRQESKHPSWKGNYHGLAVLMEEVGEVAEALYESKNATDEETRKWWNDHLEAELIQVASVCSRWLENRK